MAGNGCSSLFGLLSVMALSGIMCVEVPKLKLNNGKLMPAIALGTYLGFDQGGVVKSVNKQLANVVMNAIDIGYRHFDTAAIYETEEEVGEGIRKKIEEGAITRDDVFVTTKLWNTQHKREQVPLALKQSLNKMGLNYVDLYLMHWPIGLNDDYTFSDVDFMETWRGLEDVQKTGLAKSIGVSNFNLDQLRRLIKEASIKPVAIQVEVHPQMIQSEIIEYAKSESMVVMGYSPFGSLVMRYGMQFPGPKIDEPILVEIARKYNKTTPQVVLRWQVDRNVVPLPKSTNLKRLKENIDIFDFKLEQYEIEKINQFHNNVRYTLPSFWQNHPYYPFEKIDNPQDNPFLNKRKQ
ncbi:PREDICTED: aldo-keto reductase AKR2E4-like [Papilio xuthus]|uniref:Aldo-keto reductase AKR2E4-like n=1 Tax=Papilio xuthus TaxID=66420 RepID=A0AAJ6ZMY2_PAPXU|nr:PREDICTED: aldo-keto reductase AKR2E4-like [Papilio xuthus]